MNILDNLPILLIPYGLSPADVVVLTCTMLMLCFALDDLFIDLLALIYQSKPKKLSKYEVDRMSTGPQKKIAIMVANWKEAEIIGHMVEGNLAGVDYDNYWFFLGVYPNDAGTRDAALDLSRRHPQVITVVNTLPGPTSKGQMINECARAVFLREGELGIQFDAFMIHDSEDAIHPLSLKLVNQTMNSADFVQLPVFSFNVPLHKLVGATYMDEFSEHHTKEMILRSQINAAVPSSGTGTALSRKLVLALLGKQGNRLLKEDALAEDYILGNMAKQLGFRTEFHCCYIENKAGKDFIATREFFPKGFMQSIKQKTRWCIGIVFQGGREIKWKGSLLDKYFLWRDRRGLWNSVLICMAFGVLVTFVLNAAGLISVLTLKESFTYQVLAGLMLAVAVYRVIARMRAVWITNGLSQSLLVPVRWLLANIINVIATYRAWVMYRGSQFGGYKLSWSKTTHEIPQGFGTAGARIQAAAAAGRPHLSAVAGGRTEKSKTTTPSA